MKRFIYSLTVLLALCSLLSSCSKRDFDEYQNISNQPVVLISYDQSGTLLGFIAIQDTKGISSIVISPSEGHQEVIIKALGSKLDEVLVSQDSEVSSEIREYWLGHVEATFKDGTLMALEGNGIRSPSRITPQTLSEVDRKISEGVFTYPQNFPGVIN
jgi:major membrane immunogen (membrane-anchored lipoprotein)